MSDGWVADGPIVCRHRRKVAMDREGVVRHLGTGSLCVVVPAPFPERAGAEVMQRARQGGYQEIETSLLGSQCADNGSVRLDGQFVTEELRSEGTPDPITTVVQWVPTVPSDGLLEGVSLEEWVGQALGAASTCWVGGTGALEFDSARCVQVFEGLMAHLRERGVKR